MKIFHHPIVKISVYLIFSVSVLFTSNINQYFLYIIILFILKALEGISFSKIIHSLKTFLLFMPFMFFVYILISLFFSDSSFIMIVKEISTALCKFILVIAAMNLYHLNRQPGQIFTALRSVWSRWNKPWRKMEDLFLFMELTFRFYPELQIDWVRTSKINNALGFSVGQPGTLMKWREIARQLPSMIILHLHRADDITQSMILRGYGEQIPRGVAHPVPFTFIHGFTILLWMFFFLFVHRFA